MKKLLLFIFLIQVVIIGQTPITSADVANIFAIGKAWVSTSNDDPQTSMDIGSAGSSSQDWMVPNIAWKDTFTAVNISPANTPFASDFPTATHAQYTNGSQYGYTGTLYSYFRLDNNSLYSLGTAASVKFGTIDTLIVSKTESYLFSLPVTYGTTKQLSSDTADVGGGLVYITSTSQSVNAFGNLTFPFGTFPALRIALVEETKAYMNGSLVFEESQPSFTWIAKDAGVFQVDIDTGSGTSGNVTLTSAQMTQYITAPTVVNETRINKPDHFALYQNYPNPFNPSTKIQYSVPGTAAGVMVTLKIYNVLGNEVATLVNEEKPAGNYEIEFSANNINGAELSSGVYFYRLTAGSFMKTRKMILLK
ncbi:MAG: T9SS type A sorting domain-containing protein [Ignavibacteriaceae bacterium]